jgi:hypothetical protein
LLDNPADMSKKIELDQLRAFVTKHGDQLASRKDLKADEIIQTITSVEAGRQLSPASIRTMTPLRADLRLFAPAHLGYTITGLPALLLEMPGLNWLARSFLRFSTSSVDLLPTSPILESIKTETSTFADTYSKIPSLRARILWGEDEKVVYMGSYKNDEEIEPLRGMDHFSICKPTEGYTYPLEFVQYGAAAKSKGI